MCPRTETAAFVQHILFDHWNCLSRNPHRGSAGARLGLIAASAASCLLQRPNKHLLRNLQSSSAELERISDAFSLLPRKVNRIIQEYSFQEDRGMASAIPPIGGKV
jgi:hypothetical protein